MASARRERKRARVAVSLIDGIRPEVLAAYKATRIICDKCGLDQAYYRNLTCAAFTCDGESGVMMDRWDDRFAV